MEGKITIELRTGHTPDSGSRRVERAYSRISMEATIGKRVPPFLLVARICEVD